MCCLILKYGFKSRFARKLYMYVALASQNLKYSENVKKGYTSIRFMKKEVIMFFCAKPFTIPLSMHIIYVLNNSNC